MTRLSQLVSAAGLVAALAGSAACATSINKVLADPSRYRDREVTVSGTVGDSFWRWTAASIGFRTTRLSSG